MSNDSTAIISDIGWDDWDESDETAATAALVQSLDSRRRIENKLEDLRLRRETCEFDFEF